METFYVDRPSPLHSLNPLTKLMGTLTLVLLAFLLPWFWLPTAFFLLIVLPLSFVGRVAPDFLRAVARIFGTVGLLLVILQTLFYPYGDTILFQVWFLEGTLEGLRRGYLLASRLGVLVGAFTLMLLTTHPSTLMRDLSRRGLPAAIAYIVTSAFQIAPQIEARASRIIDAQRARGLETEGGLRRRIGALLPLVAPLVFSSLADVEERTIAIEARAFSAPGRKTTLVEIPDSGWERILRWLGLLLIIAALVARLWLSFT